MSPIVYQMTNVDSTTDESLSKNLYKTLQKNLIRDQMVAFFIQVTYHIVVAYQK